jgi:hypothetical protein
MPWGSAKLRVWTVGMAISASRGLLALTGGFAPCGQAGPIWLAS